MEEAATKYGMYVAMSVVNKEACRADTGQLSNLWVQLESNKS